MASRICAHRALDHLEGMKLNRDTGLRQRLRADWRWMVVASLVIALAVLGQFCFAEFGKRPDMGIRAGFVDGKMVITWSQTNGWARELGVTAGLEVVSVDGVTVTPDFDPSVVSQAQTVVVRESDASLLIVSSVSLPEQAEARKWSFLAMAVAFMLVGSVVFLLATDVLAASVLLGVTSAGSAVFLTAMVDAFGTFWVISLENVMIWFFATFVLCFFLVFPLNRLATGRGRWFCSVAIAANVVVTLWTIWALFNDGSGANALHYLGRTLMVLDMVVAVGSAVVAARDRSATQPKTRQALGLIALGAVGGLLPFSLFSVVPDLFGLGYLIPVDVSSMSFILLVASLGAAILGQQMMGVRGMAERGLIALLVWLGLIACFSIGLSMLHGGLFDSMLLKVTVVAALFPPTQSLLRKHLERWLLRDVYDYAQTLQTLAAEIAVISGVEIIANHVLVSLAKTLDLGWAVIVLRDEATTPLVYRWGDWPARIDWPRLLDDDYDPRADAPGVTPTMKPKLVPLVTDGEPIGVLAIGPKRQTSTFTPEDSALLSTLAPLVATSLRNALLLRALERQVEVLRNRETSLSALSMRLMHVQEEERKSLALELHDDLLQRAILLARDLGKAPQNEQMEDWRQAVEEITYSLRAICADLRPPVLDDLGLVAGLERLVNNLRARSDLEVRLFVEAEDTRAFGRLEPKLEVALYRVAQEALYNCLKHANATTVTVRLLREGTMVQVKVVDDGQGYHPKANGGTSTSGLGILGMRERLRPWNGILTVEMGPQGGTVVLAEVLAQEQEVPVLSTPNVHA